jgi:hypothetical protein
LVPGRLKTPAPYPKKILRFTRKVNDLAAVILSPQLLRIYFCGRDMNYYVGWAEGEKEE